MYIIPKIANEEYKICPVVIPNAAIKPFILLELIVFFITIMKSGPGTIIINNAIMINVIKPSIRNLLDVVLQFIITYHQWRMKPNRCL